MEILFYFANDFDYTEELVQKFRRIARFYLKESIRHYCGHVNLLYALRLQTISKAKLLQEKAIPEENNRDVCFP